MVLGWIAHRTNVVRAYPWTDFRKMPMDKAFTSWPFYYLADYRHNPDKGVIFTPVYHDPLSKEWMISSLYPVYLSGRHEATVGLDLTIHNLLNEIKGVRFSKGSSSLLISTTEIIVASDNFPVASLGLTTGIPPHGQNLAASTVPAVRKLSETLHTEKQGITVVEADGLRMFAGYATVEPLGWKIVL
jgi:hypothetical protein